MLEDWGELVFKGRLFTEALIWSFSHVVPRNFAILCVISRFVTSPQLTFTFQSVAQHNR